MLSSSKQLNRCIIPATFNLGCVFVFFFFRMMSVIIMVGFLFTICIVLLNMLIGQVSDTFQKFQQDEQREYEVNRASIVMRMEQTSLCFCKVIYFIVKLKKSLIFHKDKSVYLPQRTNFKMSQIWYPLFAMFKIVLDSLCYFLNT